MSDHLFFIIALWSFVALLVVRAYFTGVAYGQEEKISALVEGKFLWILRNIIGVFLMAIAFFYLSFPEIFHTFQIPLPIGVRVLGAFFELIGVFLYTWTHFHLGKNFTDTVVVRKGAHLVQSGPYQYMRHPMYVSAFFIFGGGFLMTEIWLVAFFGGLLLLLILIFRTPEEERRLVQEFGDDYLAYKKRVGIFFPK